MPDSRKDNPPLRSGLWTALAGGSALGAALTFGGVGFTSLAAEDAKPAAKKGEDAKPADKVEIHVGPPPELAALRKAVEEASKKGENVDDIRARMDALEKAMTGRSWKKPSPPAEAARPDQPSNRFPAPPNNFPRIPLQMFPDGGLDAQAMQKVQEMLRKAMENAQDPEAFPKAVQEYQKAMRDAMGQLGGRIIVGNGLMRADPLGLPPSAATATADLAFVSKRCRSW